MRNATPCQKSQLSEFERLENGPRSSAGIRGMRRNVPIAPLLAPQLKAREKKKAAGEQHAPKNKRALFT